MSIRLIQSSTLSPQAPLGLGSGERLAVGRKRNKQAPVQQRCRRDAFLVGSVTFLVGSVIDQHQARVLDLIDVAAEHVSHLVGIDGGSAERADRLEACPISTMGTCFVYLHYSTPRKHGLNVPAEDGSWAARAIGGPPRNQS